MSVTQPPRRSQVLRALVGTAALIGAFSGTAVVPQLSIPAAAAAGDVEGSVWQDTKPNGVRDVAAPTESGIQGITVTIFDKNEQVAGTATTDANGSYAVTPTAAGPWRLEFTNLPDDYVFGRQTTSDKGSSVRFVAAAGTGNDLAVNLLGDYCQNDPAYITNCFTTGRADQGSATRSSVYQIPGTARGYEGGPFWTPITNKALFNQTGATYGLGYQPTSNSWFAGAYLRRFSGFGPAGISGIYKNGATFIKLSDYGISAGTDPHSLTSAVTFDNHDAATFAQVGKIGLGDVDVSVDGKRLYVVNMNTKQLIAIPITRAGALDVASLSAVAAPNAVPGAQEIGRYDIPAPTGCAPASWRPMGIGIRGTSLFIGGTCSNRQVSIHKLNPATAAWTQSVASFDVSYARKGGETFNNWNDTETQLWNQPQAMVADIAFDGQDLILGLRDRYGDQTGYNSLTTNTADTTTRYSSQTAGDTLRACWWFELDAGKQRLVRNAHPGRWTKRQRRSRRRRVLLPGSLDSLRLQRGRRDHRNRRSARSPQYERRRSRYGTVSRSGGDNLHGSD
jgi:SdrD B-like domain